MDKYLRLIAASGVFLFISRNRIKRLAIGIADDWKMLSIIEQDLKKHLMP